MVPSIPLLSYESSVSVKENPDRKKSIFCWWYANSILQKIEKELGINSRKASKLIPKLYSAETYIPVKNWNRYIGYSNLNNRGG